MAKPKSPKEEKTQCGLKNFCFILLTNTASRRTYSHQNNRNLIFTYLDLHVIIQEDVSKLQVSVDDPVVVQVLDTLEQLGHVVSSLGLGHSLTTLVQLQQRLEKENHCA